MMEVKDIFSEETTHEEAKETIKDKVRSIVDDMAEIKSDEKSNDNEQNDDSENLGESMKVTAFKGVGNSEEIEVQDFSELKKLAQTGKFDQFTVKDENGEESEFSVDPSGNLVEI